MPSEWEGEHSSHTSHQVAPESIIRDTTLHGGMTVYLKLDNTLCKRNCFKRIERAAQFISTALQNGWDPGIPLTTVGGEYWCFSIFLKKETVKSQT